MVAWIIPKVNNFAPLLIILQNEVNNYLNEVVVGNMGHSEINNLAPLNNTTKLNK